MLNVGKVGVMGDRYEALVRQAGVASTLPAIVMVLRVAHMSHRLGRLTDEEYASVIKTLDYRTIVISSKGMSTGVFQRVTSKVRRH
jgi:hypothetical protein